MQLKALVRKPAEFSRTFLLDSARKLTRSLSDPLTYEVSANQGSKETGEARTEVGVQPGFVNLIRHQYNVERSNRKTGQTVLVSMDEALDDLRGFHTNPLQLLIQCVNLPTPWAFYRLHFERTYVN